MALRAIADTNVFVGAGFNPGSASAHILEAAAEGRLALVWHATTREETVRILEKIPRLAFAPVAAAFLPAHEHPDPLDLAAVGFVDDPEDRKFAALAMATGAPLISSDKGLLAHADRLGVVTPSAFLAEALGARSDRP